jgi:hypothetical protein
MQQVQEIEISKMNDIVNSIFQVPAIAYEDYSDLDSDLKKYDSKESLLKAIDEANTRNAHSANFAIYYPEAKGHFFKEKKSVNPEKCNGASYRYIASGWGLVHLQIDLRKKPIVKVRVAVNTATRAETWSATSPEFKDPSLWDWKYVEKQTRRIIRVLKQCA